MVGILGNLIAMIADLSLLLILASALFVVNPSVAFTTVFLFSFVGYFLYRLLHNRAQDLGQRNTELSIASSSKILEVFSSYRVLFVRGGRGRYSEEIGHLRLELGKVVGESAFIPYISKYVIEAIIVLGSLALAASQFLLKDATNAVATLTIFLAAGSRIAPASLRIQQGALQIKNNLGICKPTLDFINDFNPAELEVQKETFLPLDFTHKGFISEVTVSNVTFQYPSTAVRVLSNVKFSVSPGELVSIVGPSGSGKSTLADLILGIIEPQLGQVQISGLRAEKAIRKWPGAIGYVPQDVSIMSGTIRDNIVMGLSEVEISEKMIKDCLRIAQLEEFVSSLPQGINTAVGEQGAKLSGGQKQRLGIARALVTNPQLIIFDEATSALDGVTEAAISKAIQALKGKISIILIAHRLSTVRNSDQIIYISNGEMICKGSFDFVRNEIPDFDTQASLMGL
jgi:ABC-type multidrug transport system fused ATPase/permease subunit